jgi:acetyl esterase/lipase
VAKVGVREVVAARERQRGLGPLVVGLYMLAAAQILACVGDSSSSEAPAATGSPGATASVSESPTETETAAAAASPTPADEMDTLVGSLVADVDYFEGFLLDVYVPPGAGPFPTVVTFHGGGGQKSQMAPLATALAEDGYVVFNAQWLARPPLDAAATIQSFDAAACALRFAAAEADEYGGEPSTLTVIGMSAGGLAGAVASLSADEFGGVCSVPGDAPPVGLFVGLEGAYIGATESGGLAGAAREQPELHERLDPRTYLSEPASTRVVLFLGDEFAAAVIPREEFAAALEQAEVRFELREVSGPHAVSTFIDGVLALLAE